MIHIKDISLSYGEQIIFSHVNSSFEPGQKVGVVGRNGSGKSTLLKAIGNHIQLDDGVISIPKDTAIAYMPQELVLHSKRTVFEETCSIFKKQLEQLKQKESIEKQLELEKNCNAALIETYHELLEKLKFFDLPSVEKKAHEILSGLGFSPKQKKKPVNTLSTGWQMRVVLAKLLLQQADFYLFDEPTNHLDIVTKEWFAQFLREASFGFLLVTHDKYFLDSVCTTIFELNRGAGTLYYGNFSYYQKQKSERDLIQKSSYERQQKEIARKKRTIERFRSKSSKAKMVQSMIKQLDRMELVEIEPEEPDVSISFPPIERAGNIILQIKNVSHAYESTQIFNNLSCTIQRGKKIALVAPNGVGKTTLFNLIVNKLPRKKGTITLGHNVKLAYFEQDQTRVLQPQNTIFEEVSNHAHSTPDNVIRTFLGTFLFSGDTVEKKINVLSGGERNRVAMVKVLLEKANFLILDEPTNHLDLTTKNILLKALKQYKGTILLVSHDHYFIQELADAILELTPDGLFHYPGTFEEFLQDKKNHQTNTQNTTQSSKEKPSHQSKQTYQQQKELKKLENKIHKLERERDAVAQELANLDPSTRDYTQVLESIQVIQEKLDTHFSEWEKLLS